MSLESRSPVIASDNASPFAHRADRRSIPWTKRARNHLRRYSLLVRTSLVLRGWARLMVWPGYTEICIEGYPRSANSSTYRMFRLANPKTWVAHHTHTIANVASALRNRVPTLILLRHPLDAICSTLLYSASRDLDTEVLRYLTFYEYVLAHRRQVVVAEFYSLIANWNGAIERLNRRFGTKFEVHEEESVGREKANRYIRKWFENAPRSVQVAEIPLPSEERKELKDKMQEIVVRHPLYGQAVAIYEEMLKECDIGRAG